MIWFFHIPHTGGRGLGRFLWLKEISYIKIHNSVDFINVHKDRREVKMKYFILRESIERGYKEFLHYSRRLDSLEIVNHLNINEILKENPNFNHQDPKDYFSLEINRNLLCKFLLEREDFTIPIIQKDYESINLNNFVYDLFTNLPHLPKLGELLGIEIDVPNIGASKKTDVPEEIKKIIEENNYFDIMLYSKITF